MLPADKQVLRETCTATRRARPSADLDAARAAITGHVLARATSLGWRSVAAYEAMRTEPGSDGLLGALQSAGIRVLVPLLLPDRDLDWQAWQGTAGPACGPHALATVDAALVPALAVALDGTRLGRGGGSYDRALTRVAPGTVVAALLFDGELVDELPREPWDVPVQAVVTPSGWRDLPAVARNTDVPGAG